MLSIIALLAMAGSLQPAAAAAVNISCYDSAAAGARGIVYNGSSSMLSGVIRTGSFTGCYTVSISGSVVISGFNVVFSGDEQVSALLY